MYLISLYILILFSGLLKEVWDFWSDLSLFSSHSSIFWQNTLAFISDLSSFSFSSLFSLSRCSIIFCALWNWTSSSSIKPFILAFSWTVSSWIFLASRQLCSKAVISSLMLSISHSDSNAMDEIDSSSFPMHKFEFCNSTSLLSSSCNKNNCSEADLFSSSLSQSTFSGKSSMSDNFSSRLCTCSSRQFTSVFLTFSWSCR